MSSGASKVIVSSTLSIDAKNRAILKLSVGRRQSRRQRRAAAAAHAAEQSEAATVCFDLGSFSSVMTDGEISALTRQIVQVYGYNRSLEKPFRLSLAGLRSAAPIVRQLEVHSASNWVVQRSDAPPWEGLAAGSELVYLSADAEEALPSDLLMHGKLTLVVGGLVDHADGQVGGTRVGAALRVASAHGVRACRLPIERFVTVRKPSLTCLAVVQILACYAQSGDWGAAVRAAPAMRCAPLAKYVRWKEEGKAEPAAPSSASVPCPAADRPSGSDAAEANGAAGGRAGLLTASASEVHSYFASRLGPTEEAAFEAMCQMDIDDLEELQGEADNVWKGGRDDEAQQAGLDWSTRISRYIA